MSTIEQKARPIRMAGGIVCGWIGQAGEQGARRRDVAGAALGSHRPATVRDGGGNWGVEISEEAVALFVGQGADFAKSEAEETVFRPLTEMQPQSIFVTIQIVYDMDRTEGRATWGAEPMFRVRTERDTKREIANLPVVHGSRPRHLERRVERQEHGIQQQDVAEEDAGEAHAALRMVARRSISARSCSSEARVSR